MIFATLVKAFRNCIDWLNPKWHFYAFPSILSSHHSESIHYFYLTYSCNIL